MPPPSNTTAPTAMDVGAIPWSIVEDTSGATGPDYEVWFVYTAVADGVVGVWAQAPTTSNYLTYTTVFTGPDAMTLTEYLFIEADQVPFSVPVTAGESYWFQVIDYDGAMPNASLTFSGVAAADSDIPIGSLVISDFVPGFPAVYLSETDGTILGQRFEIPASDFGDILPNGITAWIDDSSTPPHVILLDTALIVIADMTGLTNGLLFQQIRANGSDMFFVGKNNNASSSTISTVDMNGAVGGTTWTLGANSQGLVAMAPSRDNTILYYGGLNGGSQAVHRHDLINDVPLSDLVAAVGANTLDKDLLVMSDGSILVVYRDSTPPVDDFVRQYDAAGSTLNTYAIPTGEALDRIALNKDDGSDTFWAWSFPDNASCRFREIRISDGAVLVTFDVPQFNNGVSGETFATSMSRFGISNSCPLIIWRSFLQGGGGNGGGVIGPLAWVHWPRRIP